MPTIRQLALISFAYEWVGDLSLIERLLPVARANYRLRKRTYVPLERNYNSSWMLRVLGKIMGPSDLR